MASINDSISAAIQHLEHQEKNLKAQLDKIAKAKALLIGESVTDSPSKPAKRRGRKPGPKKGTAKSAGRPAKKSVGRPAKKSPGRPPASASKLKAGAGRKKGRVTYLDKIKDLLKSTNKPMSPNEIIDQLFANDPSKDLKAFGKNIYPVFSRSYKNKALVKKNGKIQVPK